MASDFLPPSPCLLGILLVVKVNSETGIVFHYPPRPGQDNSHFTRYLAAREKDQDGSSSTDDDSTSSHDDGIANNGKLKESKTGDNTPELDLDETGSISPEKNPIWKSQYGKPKWNDLFGLPSYELAKLLTPPPTSHKKKFELSIDDKVFIGQPIFAREGEHWKKKKDKKVKTRKSRRATESNSAQQPESSTDASEHHENPDDIFEPRKQEMPAVDADQSSLTSPEPTTQETKPKKKNTLNMFHVVFVLNPPPLEYQLRVKEIYDHVVKKFSKALKWEQARSNYVMREISALSTASKHMKKAHGEVDLSLILPSTDAEKVMTSL